MISKIGEQYWPPEGEPTETPHRHLARQASTRADPQDGWRSRRLRPEFAALSATSVALAPRDPASLPSFAGHHHDELEAIMPRGRERSQDESERKLSRRVSAAPVLKIPG